MPARQRYVFIGAMVLAAVVGMALAHGFSWLAGQAGLADPTPLGVRELPASVLLAYGLSFASAFLLLRNPKSNAWAGEVVEELMRVAWPSQEETRHATMVVIVAVIVCSAYLGLFDAFWLSMTDFILGGSSLRNAG